MGLIDRFVSGLEWVFDLVDEAIILEDDCVPSVSFFRFCETMLDVYREDERIMDIGGTNYLETWKSDQQDYHLSRFGGIWGWATWRRSWEWYDPEMSLWTDTEARSILRSYWPDTNHARYIEYIMQRAYDGEIASWAYPWGFARMLNSAYAVVPAKNLVSNVGFGDEASNTRNDSHRLSNIPAHKMDFPIQIRHIVGPDRDYDKLYYKTRPISHRTRVGRLLKELAGF
jgi:hypothetical protein